MKIINSLITIGFLIGAQQANATDKQDEPELSWCVGLAITSEDEGYTELGSDSTAVPIFINNYGKFYLMGLKFGYQLYGNDNYAVGLSSDQ